MKILITGAAGFIGGYLARHCVERGGAVLGTDIQEPGDSCFSGTFERCDVRDPKHVFETVNSFRPDRIFHLAAQSYPTISMGQPLDTMATNAGGTINVMEAVRAAGIDPVVVVACSSGEYGNVAREDLPVREEHALLPLHPYGVSKVAQDLLAAQYFANYKLRTVRIRIFNTTGPRKTGDICSDFTRRAVEVELGIRPSPVAVGNLATRRAIIDVRDMVRGLCLAAEHCSPGEVYNLGGTAIHSGAELLEAIRPNISTPFTVWSDPALIRTCDEPVIAGDVTKFQQCCAWKPEIGIAQTIREMTGWWRDLLASRPAAPNEAAYVAVDGVRA